jgi:hypothetical protein
MGEALAPCSVDGCAGSAVKPRIRLMSWLV